METYYSYLFSNAYSQCPTHQPLLHGVASTFKLNIVVWTFCTRIRGEWLFKGLNNLWILKIVYCSIYKILKSHVSSNLGNKTKVLHDREFSIFVSSVKVPTLWLRIQHVAWPHLPRTHTHGWTEQRRRSKGWREDRKRRRRRWRWWWSMDCTHNRHTHCTDSSGRHRFHCTLLLHGEYRGIFLCCFHGFQQKFS